MSLFNRTLYHTRRDKAAAGYAKHNFLKELAAERVGESLACVNRTFHTVLDLGCNHGELAAHLPERSEVKTLIHADASREMLSHVEGAVKVRLDEEWLPFADNSLDAVLSCLSLHHVNDMVGSLIQVQKALKPDGLFSAVMYGPNTLIELREVLQEAEIMLTGGVAPRIAPFPEIRDAGNLLGRAGFALPVLDSELLTVSYNSIYDLMREIRGMGETNILSEQPKHITHRQLFDAADLLYKERYLDDEGRITATVEFLTLSAWKPAPNQQQPLERGSGQVSMVDVF